MTLSNSRKTYSISLIKNEEDIIESFVRYHAAIFDCLVIMDNKSSDETLPILYKLKKEGLPLIIFEDHDGEFTQGEKTTNLLNWTFTNKNADFIIPLDADEFLIATNNHSHPRDLLSEIDLKKVFALKRINYIPQESDNQVEAFIPKRITHYRKGEKEVPSKITVSKQIFEKYAPAIQNGNHNLHLEDTKLDKEIFEDLTIAHYPIRTVEQLKSKMIVKWLNKTARQSSNIRPAKNSRYFYNLANMDYHNFIKKAETFRVRNKGSNKFSIVDKAIDLSFCEPIKLKYTSDQPTNWLRNLVLNMEQMALDYAKLKQELAKYKDKD